MEGFKPLKELIVGEASLVSVAVANPLVQTVNALGNMKIAPFANVGKILISQQTGQCIFDLSALDSRLRAVEGAVQTNYQSQINNINSRLNNATINASGTCTGNNIEINISLNI